MEGRGQAPSGAVGREGRGGQEEEEEEEEELVLGEPSGLSSSLPLLGPAGPAPTTPPSQQPCI